MSHRMPITSRRSQEATSGAPSCKAAARWRGAPSSTWTDSEIPAAREHPLQTFRAYFSASSSPFSATSSIGEGGRGGGGPIWGPNPAPNPMANAPNVRQRRRRMRDPIQRRNHATTRSRRARLDMLSLSFAAGRTTRGRRGSQQRSEQWRRYFRAMSARGDWSGARSRTSSGETS